MKQHSSQTRMAFFNFKKAPCICHNKMQGATHNSLFNQTLII